MTGTELQPLGELAELGKMLAASGYFSDAKDAAQAVTKVLAGRELGFPPISAMTGIYIVKGRVTLSANLMAAAIKRHPRYDYRVLDLSNESAEVAFFESGEQVGTSQFTIADAQRAGLAGGENWKKYPRNMLLWRALSNGAKFYCPDAFSGAPVYTPDELGAEVDPETGEVIDVDESAPVSPAPAPVTDWTRRSSTRAQEALRASPETLEELPSDETPQSEADTSSPARSGAASPQGASRPTVDAEGRPDVEAATPSAPAPADGEPISEEELAKLREYLDALEAPESFWRMGVMSFGVSELSELSKAQARELMQRAKARFGART